VRRRGLSPFRAALAVLALLLVAAVAGARPGGGDAFDGGSPLGGGDGDGGGGGDVDIGLVIELVVLCVRYPQLGAVVVLGLGGYWVFGRLTKRGQKDWSVGAPPTRVHAARHANVSRSTLERLRADDPAFSGVLLEYFV
jgi:hypothetical protein